MSKDFIKQILAPRGGSEGLWTEAKSFKESTDQHVLLMQTCLFPSPAQVGGGILNPTALIYVDFYDANKAVFELVLDVLRECCIYSEKTSKKILKPLLKPCSFSQALSMMEKGAVMQDDEGRFFKLDENCLFVWMQSYVVEKGEIVWGWWLLDDFNSISHNDLTTSKWHYTPWFKDGEVDQELTEFCDEILGVGNE
jgi:hypothetical protein